MEETDDTEARRNNLLTAGMGNEMMGWDGVCICCTTVSFSVARRHKSKYRTLDLESSTPFGFEVCFHFSRYDGLPKIHWFGKSCKLQAASVSAELQHI